MNWKQLKEQYALFKQWQQQPVKFENVEDEHCCHCCGMTYTGNYCPCCSQKADQGRINWQSVRRGVMDIWGLGSRSLPYSILQLLFRPGYFIRDYISGKRQVSFPPVKMLFIVAVIYSFLFYWIYPEILHIELIAFDKETAEVMPFVGWIRKYFSWMSLLTSFLYLLPTWLLFRHAPRYPSHTLPEGFFIQVLMSVLLIVVDVICKIICGRNVMLSSSLLIVLLVIYYYVAYRQLFCYGVWGTI